MKIILSLALLLTTCSAVKPPQTVNVPDDYATLQEAIDALPNGGTVILEPGTYSGLRSYGTERTASIVINGNRNIIIEGNGSVITYDEPPTFYGEWGSIVVVSNKGQTTFNDVHFIGTRSLGDALYDIDVCLYLISSGDLTVTGSEFSECGHAGVKHGANAGTVIFDNNICHDIGFTNRDHCIYFPGGGDYIITNNKAWNITGGGFGIGNSYWNTGGLIENNVSVNNGYGIWTPWGEGVTMRNNFAMGNIIYDLGIYGGGHNIRDNVFGTVNAERSCGGMVTNWCADPVSNVFYRNHYKSIDWAERIE